MSRYKRTYLTSLNTWDLDGNIDNAIKMFVDIRIGNSGYEKIEVEVPDESGGIDFFGLTRMTEEEYQADVARRAELIENREREVLAQLKAKYE